MNKSEEDNNGSVEYSDSENELTLTRPESILIIVNFVLNAPLVLVSIVSNALVLSAIIRTPSIRSRQMIMLCSLAVSDILVGLIAQPIYCTLLLTKDFDLYHASTTMGYSLCGVSFLTITAITLDRFLALHYHMSYASLVTKRRVKYTLIIIWLFSLLIAGLHFLSFRLQNSLVSIVTITCLIMCTFCYIRIYRIVRRHQFQINAQQQAALTSDAAKNLNIARLRKSALNTFVFYIALILCYFPIFVSLGLTALSFKDWQTEWEFANTAVFLNSSINPFLYCWRLRELRKEVFKTARQLSCKETEEES